MMKFSRLIFGLLLMVLAGCLSQPVTDITSLYAQTPVLQSGYRLGGHYVLQQDLFVTKSNRPDYRFTKPGDGVPTMEGWKAGVRKPQFFKVITLLPAGTKVSVEKIIFLRASGSGVSHATGMLRAEGVDLLINPFSVSHFVSVTSYGTLCLPDEQFLQTK
jgi:hypothetical protein